MQYKLMCIYNETKKTHKRLKHTEVLSPSFLFYPDNMLHSIRILTS